MKRRAVCFLLCLSFFLCTVSLKSSAVDEDVLYTADDLIDFGFDYNSDEGIYTYSGNDDPFGGFSFFASSEKNYPNFNPLTDVPWSSFPQYIKDILEMSLDGLMTEYGQPFKLPFFLIRVNGNNLNIFAGVNVGIGQTNHSNRYCYIYGYSGGDAAQYIYPYSILYRCDYNYSSQFYVNNWSKCSASPVGDTGTLFNFTDSSSILTDWGSFDFYFYGANGVSWSSKYTSVTVPYNSTNSNEFVSFRLSKNGFESGDFLVAQSSGFANSYFQYIVPPSQESINQQLQEEENKTSKSILERIKELPSNIAESFKGLFIPSDGFFDTYQQEFQTYFKDRFGILYEIPELIISLLQKFVSFNPQEDNYSITFPSLVIPIQEDGEWKDFTLSEAQEFSFDFINQAPFNALYDIYIAFLWFVYIMLLVNLIKNKANGVFKGG